MTRDILVLKRHTLLFPAKNMLTTATTICSIWTRHVNTGKGHVVTFVVVPILCNYRDNIVICPYYCDIAFHMNAQAIASFPSRAWERVYAQA